ncbi:MAG: beta-ketoacyl-[acyl-carrier-protein] synthase family protein [Terriglobia bacterium]
MTRRVVITGIGAISPNGMGRETFWQNTRMGISGVDTISLFDSSHLSARIAGEVKHLDGDGFIKYKDRPHVSRVVPLALAASDEALRDAGLEVDSMTKEEKQQIGVMLGTGGGSVEFTEEMYRLYYTGQSKRVSVYTIPSSTIGTLASEISMRFGLRGLSHVVSTGCTSSTDALGHAALMIRSGMIDKFLVGGADAPIAPLIMGAFCLMRILTPSWNHDPKRGSRPFSQSRDGFVLGEGAWMFVLEELHQALSRGARIYGEVAGYGSTCDAYHRVRMDESGEEPARAMNLAMKEAQVSPEAVDYINLHGTSTLLNDRIETRAVKLSFGAKAFTLPGSSLKSMIGHPQGACGAAGVAASLLAMRDHVLPPTINLEDPDSECDLDYIPEIGRRKEIDVVLCNCIAFGSKNSALVLKRVNGKF